MYKMYKRNGIKINFFKTTQKNLNSISKSLLYKLFLINDQIEKKTNISKNY